MPAAELLLSSEFCKFFTRLLPPRPSLVVGKREALPVVAVLAAPLSHWRPGLDDFR